MADEKMSKAVAMLCEKYEQLGTLPKRSDFTPSEACFIKQKLVRGQGRLKPQG